MTRARPQRGARAGFTLVELIVVLILVGILAFTALPRFADRVFDERGTHDTVKAAVQHARHVAVASRRFVCVTAYADRVALTMDARLPETAAGDIDCTAPVALAGAAPGCAANVVCAPAGVALGGAATIRFDPLGRSVTAARLVEAASLSITVPHQAPISVNPQTGWVQ